VDEAVFRLFPTFRVGVVAARGARNGPSTKSSKEALDAALRAAQGELGPLDPRAHPAIEAWRAAFAEVGINPNKYPSSIEALTRRVSKGGALPAINLAVDLANSAALTFLVPVGCHDLGRLQGDLEVRLSRPGEVFRPMGGGDAEPVDAGEVVYGDGLEVRTRRWVWRQGDGAKVTEDSADLFFPIDGFGESTLDRVTRARDYLAGAVREHLGGRIIVGMAQRDSAEVHL
jgi:DNA/RNA-binding domain of Phe-tRNA-synthetase-like protein